MRGPLYIVINPLLDKTLTGIGRFTARLVDALVRFTPLRLVSPAPGPLAGQEIAVDGADLPEIRGDLDAWTRDLLQRPRQPHDRDLARQSAAVYSLLRPNERHFGREIGIFYDFSPLILPWSHATRTQGLFGHYYAHSAKLCDKVIAISHSTKADARWLSAVDANDVVVGYPGPSLCARAHAHPASVTRRDDVLLVVSTLEPRKNGRFLLDWFYQTHALPPGMTLCWVGPSGWWVSQEWLTGMSRPGRRSHRSVRFLGLVPDRRLCRLYRRARFTIYPSLYEGFGFPVLDSLRHGTPVVCSYNSSLQEFEGPGVVYFDACDPASLDEACREVLISPASSVCRADLDTRFSWEKLARTVMRMCA